MIELNEQIQKTTKKLEEYNDKLKEFPVDIIDKMEFKILDEYYQLQEHTTHDFGMYVTLKLSKKQRKQQQKLKNKIKKINDFKKK